MKIGIVGGGISGLYCANLLEERGYDVTIFENNKWGGDIQTTTINGKCYPISTVFINENHDLLKQQMQKYGLDDYDYDFERYGKDEYSIRNAVISYIGLMLVGLYGMYKKSKVCLGLLVFLIIILLMIIIPGTNCVKTFFHKKYLYPTILAFGGVPNYEQYRDEYIHTFNLADYMGPRNLWAFINESHYKMPKNCGFYQLVQKYMKNKNIKYIHGNIKKIERQPNAKIHFSDGSLTNHIYNFDKIIIACGYNCYKNILPLSNIENQYFSDAQTFEYHTTILRIKNKSDLEKICTENDIFGYYMLDRNLISVATPRAIKCDNGLQCRNFEWRMHSVSGNEKKQLMNKKGKKVLFIGKEMLFSGVEYCMRYAKHVCDNFI